VKASTQTFEFAWQFRDRVFRTRSCRRVDARSWAGAFVSAWQKFDQQASKFGKPTAVWVQICIFAQNGATYDEVKRTRLRTAVTPTRQAGNRSVSKP